MEKELSTEAAFISLVPLIIGANSGPGTIFAGLVQLWSFLI